MMIGSITALGGLPGSFNSPATQQNTQAPTEAQFNQWLTQKGLTANQVRGLSTAQKETYLRQMQTEIQTQGVYSNFGRPSTAINTNGLVNASLGNPLNGAQTLGLGGNLPNANAITMGVTSFGKVNAQAAAIIAQILQAGAGVDPVGAFKLKQTIDQNATWQLSTNPQYQFALAQIQPQLQMGQQQFMISQQQIQDQQRIAQAKAAQEKAQIEKAAAEEKTKKAKKTDDA